MTCSPASVDHDECASIADRLADLMRVESQGSECSFLVLLKRGTFVDHIPGGVRSGGASPGVAFVAAVEFDSRSFVVAPNIKSMFVVAVNKGRGARCKLPRVDDGAHSIMIIEDVTG